MGEEDSQTERCRSGRLQDSLKGRELFKMKMATNVVDVINYSRKGYFSGEASII